MKVKGFTLTEMLGVIVIIALLLLLIVPNIINRISDSTDEAENTENNLIYKATDQYIRENPDKFPPGKSGRYCITIQELIEDGKLVEPVTDVRTGEDISDKSVMVTIYSTGNTEYEIKEGDECEEISALPMIDFIVEPSGSGWVKQRTVTIIYPKVEGEYEASHRISNGEWIRDESADEGGNVEIVFKKISTLEARLKSSQIISSKINVINVDSEKPVVRKISVPSSWTNKNKTATATVYDSISGVQAYYLSKSSVAPSENASGWVNVNYDKGEKTISLSNLDEGTYYLWIKDKAGNISDSTGDSTFKIDKIDRVAPTCNITVGSGSLGNDDWYTSNVRLDLNYSDNADGSGVSSYGIVPSKNVTYNNQRSATQTVDTDGITYYGYVRDAAGNTHTCNLSIKKDSTSPTISGTLTLPNGSNYTQNTWSRSSVTRKLSAQDNLSGVVQVQYRASNSSTWTTEGNVDSYTLGEGNHDYYFRTIDKAGNISSELHLVVKIDWTPPYICQGVWTTWDGANLSYPARAYVKACDYLSAVQFAQYTRYCYRGTQCGSNPVGNCYNNYSVDSRHLAKVYREPASSADDKEFVAGLFFSGSCAKYYGPSVWWKFCDNAGNCMADYYYTELSY